MTSADRSMHDLTRPTRPLTRRGGARLLAATATLTLALTLPAALQAQEQEWETQIPEGSGTYPTGSLLIQDIDTVWTAAGDVLAGADILIVDGTIRQIGPDIDPPEGVQLVDGRGTNAIPGLVDEHSHTAMAATNEFSAPLVPEVRVLDALEPDDFGIYQALSGGVTTARIMHGSSNPVGGQSAVIKMRWGMEAGHDLLVPGAPRFVKFALGENVTRKGGGFSPDARFPHSRQGVEAIYRQAFTAAQAYRAEWERYEDDPEAFAVPPRRDLRMEALVDIMEGRIRIHAHSYRADEILMLMRIAEEFGFRIDVFTHVLEGYKVASEMAEHGAGGSTFTDWWQYKLEALDAIPYNAAIMHEHGVLTAINTDIPWLQSFFFHEIVKPVKYGGVSKEDALRMLTLNPARMMYIDDKVGSLEVGKQGDVVLLSGSPFDAFTRVEKTIVDGIVYFDLADEEETRGEPIITQDDQVAPVSEPMPEAREHHDISTGDATRGTGFAASESAEAPWTEERAGHVTAAVPTAAPAATRPAAKPTDRPELARRADRPELSDGTDLADLTDGTDLADSTDGAQLVGQAADQGAQEAVTALVGGTIHPVSGAPISDGVVLIRGETIEAVGTAGQVDIPAEARRIDVSGRHVYPGIIDALSTVGILEFGSVGQAQDVYEVGTYNPHIRAVAAVMPEFPNFHVTRMNGITAVGVAQSTGTIQGQLGVVELSDEDTWERVTVDDRAALVAVLPVRNRPQDPDDEPALEGDRVEEFLEVLERAELYAAEPSVADDATRRFEANVWGGDRVFLEALVPAITGAQPIIFRMDTDWQIRHLFLLMDRFPRIRPIVLGGTEAFQVADELAARDVPVLLNLAAAYRPTPDRDQSVTTSWRNAGELYAAGVTLGFASDDSEQARNLPYMAAHAVAFGLPEDQAIRAITLNNAEILGQGARMGSIEPGKRADLLVTDGSPLQYLTTIEHMFVAGAEVDPRDNRHYELYQQYRTRGN